MDLQQLLDELVLAARRLGVEVRTEPFETPAALGGGLCLVRGAQLVLIDQRAPLVDRLGALARALGDLGSEAVYMAPEARELVDGGEPASSRPLRSAGPRDQVRAALSPPGDDGDLPVRLEHRVLDLVHPLEALLMTCRLHDVPCVHALPVHARLQRPPALDEHNGHVIQDLLDPARVAPPLRQADVDADQSDDHENGVDERVVRSDQCLLRRLGDDQQEHHVERGDLRERPLAHDPEHHEQDQVHRAARSTLSMRYGYTSIQIVKGARPGTPTLACTRPME